jgi:Ca2+-binding RTX toxin-like protein
MRFHLGRRTLPVALAAVALLATPTAASPAGTIVIYGSDSGSHLTLSSNGKRIVVRGRMAREHPHGCRLRHHRLLAICRVRGAAAIEVQMGPAGDFVEVARRLPVPLTVYLGNGSDKFIGNGERDTCYSQGSRRNRCVGGPGNDVCVTGQKNSDCVGGPGNDYCHTGAGSDGCWGGPGRDVCIMGPGEDGCHGEGGDDRLYGGPGPDQLYGGRGWDYCDGLPGLGRSHDCAAGPRH